MIADRYSPSPAMKVGYLEHQSTWALRDPDRLIALWQRLSQFQYYVALR
jgi:hypothetical protein